MNTKISAMHYDTTDNVLGHVLQLKKTLQSADRQPCVSHMRPGQRELFVRTTSSLKGMKPLKRRPWIGICRGNGGEGDQNRRGGDWSTTRH